MIANFLLRPFGIDIFCTGKKFLVYNMVGRNLKVKYRRSVLGVLWTLLSPLSLVGIYYFVFKVILKVDSPNYLAYLVSGILPWAFFSQSVMEGMESISGNANLISKIPVPLQVFPLVGTATNFVTLIIAVPIMIGVALVSGIHLGPSLLALPLFLGVIALIGYAAALILGLLFVYFQDLRHITALLIQLWFYGTPVLYRAEMIPHQYKFLIYLNPIGSAIVSIHEILSNGAWPDGKHFVASIFWAIFSMFVALVVFKFSSQDVAENL